MKFTLSNDVYYPLFNDQSVIISNDYMKYLSKGQNERVYYSYDNDLCAIEENEKNWTTFNEQEVHKNINDSIQK